MHLNRILLSAVLTVFALIIQVSILARLHLPGAVPDLLLLVVVALGISYGPVGGSLVGFGAGFLSDLAPPADHAAGRYALVLCLVGYLAGLARPDNGQLRSAMKAMLVVAGAVVTSTVLYAAVGALVGDSDARSVGMSSLLVSAFFYDLLLAPFTVPWVMALARKLDHDPLSTAGLGDGGAGGTSATGSGWFSSGAGRRARFGVTGQLTGTGRVRTGLLRSGRRSRMGYQRGFGRSLGRIGSRTPGRGGLGKLGRRP